MGFFQGNSVAVQPFANRGGVVGIGYMDDMPVAEPNQVAHGIGLVSACVMTGAFLGLAFHVRRTQPGLGLVGGALCVVGAVGLGAGFAIDGFTWGILWPLGALNRNFPLYPHAEDASVAQILRIYMGVKF